MNREQLIHDILNASAKPCPAIIERFKLLGSDGNWYFATGFPANVTSTGERKSVGFSYCSPTGATFGMFDTREDAAKSHAVSQARTRDDFETSLKMMTDSQLKDQAAYWLKGTR